MQSYKVYNISFPVLAAWLTPRAFRKTRLGILVKCCVFPLTFLHNSFLKYRKAKIYQLLITPQVCYLERMLNDKYDYTLRRIRIDDAVWHLPVFIFQEDELKPVYLHIESENKPVYLYNDGEAGIALNDFVVLVPVDINFLESEMRGAIDSYKLFGTKYTIQKI